jgi:predicted RNA-binding Zn-ribbon protein involved in translation (DUF1610 family)
MADRYSMPEIQYRDWEIENEQECGECRSEELGNCPNCAEVIVRELIFRGAEPVYYWPCPECGFTHHGAEIPALD